MGSYEDAEQRALADAALVKRQERLRHARSAAPRAARAGARTAAIASTAGALSMTSLPSAGAQVPTRDALVQRIPAPAAPAPPRTSPVLPPPSTGGGDPVTPAPSPGAVPDVVNVPRVDVVFTTTATILQADTSIRQPDLVEGVTVAAGDSLWRIADRLLSEDGVDGASNAQIQALVQIIYGLNIDAPGFDPNLIDVGQVVLVPTNPAEAVDDALAASEAPPAESDEPADDAPDDAPEDDGTPDSNDSA